MKNNITITEYGYLVVDDKRVGKKVKDEKKFLSSNIDKKSFKLLKDFNFKNKDEIFHTTRYQRDGEKYDALQAKSFVGVIELKNGVVIEILPKIYTGNNKIEDIKAIFLKMLSKLIGSKFKEFGSAHLLYKKFPLLDIFVLLFMENVHSLIRRGLRGDYVNIEGNERFLKGKLIFPEHIKRNLVHKERFYVSYDEFSINTHANRLIKTTIYYLMKKNLFYETKRRLKQLLFIFDEIDFSKNIDKDFQIADTKMRLFSDYERVLTFCKVFLGRKSFVNYKGKELANAILFPMEKIFEDYIAYLVKKDYKEDYSVKIQKGGEHLIEDPGKFNLVPDILLINKNDENDKIIIDTKWKLLDKSKEKENYNISQSDLYQMFAYAKKYKANKVILIYPYTEKFPMKQDNKFIEWQFEKDISLLIIPAMLSNVINDEQEVVKKIEEILNALLNLKTH